MWNADYKIGNTQIDSQHKQLVMTLEDLLRALKAPPTGSEKRMFEETVKFLKNYVVVHFNTEEMYQASIGYTDMEAHRKMHKAFMDRMREMEIDLIRTDYDKAQVQKLADYLMHWLIDHILKEDKKMADPAYQSEKRETAEFLL